MDSIKEYKLKNENGISAIILSYGGIIKEINTPNRKGEIENIVLNYDLNDEYFNDKFYLGAIIGRCANRISNSTFKLGEKKIRLNKNEGKNHLHGGHNGFHKKNWELVHYDKNQKFVQLSINSLHLESGYPGNLKCEVIYTINNYDEIRIEFFAKSDMDTIFNPTSHSYFNLNPSNNSILKHKLKINSSNYIPINNESLPLGIIENSIKTPFDFTKNKEIGKEINRNNKQLKIGNGYDHCFVLDKEMSTAAEISDELSGRKLIISTDSPGIQFYSGNYLSGSFSKNQGLCLETQNFPDSPNNLNFPTTILKADEKYYSKTTYKFSII